MSTTGRRGEGRKRVDLARREKADERSHNEKRLKARATICGGERKEKKKTDEEERERCEKRKRPSSRFRLGGRHLQIAAPAEEEKKGRKTEKTTPSDHVVRKEWVRIARMFPFCQQEETTLEASLFKKKREKRKGGEREGMLRSRLRIDLKKKEVNHREGKA